MDFSYRVYWLGCHWFSSGSLLLVSMRVGVRLGIGFRESSECGVCIDVCIDVRVAHYSSSIRVGVGMVFAHCCLTWGIFVLGDTLQFSSEWKQKEGAKKAKGKELVFYGKGLDL